MGSGTLIGAGARFMFEENKDRKRREAEAEERRVRIEAQKISTELNRSKLQHQQMVTAITTSNGENYALAKALSDYHPGKWDFMVDEGSVNPDTGSSGFFIGEYRRNEADTGFLRDPSTGDRVFDKRMGSDGEPMKLTFDNQDQKMLWGAQMANPDLFGAFAVQRMQDKQALEQAKLAADAEVGAKTELSENVGTTDRTKAETADIREKTRLRERAVAADEARSVGAGKTTKQPITFIGIDGKAAQITKVEADQAQTNADKWSERFDVVIDAQQAHRISQIRSNKKVKGKTMSEVFNYDMKRILNGNVDAEDIKTFYVNQLGLPAAFVDEAIANVQVTKEAGGFWNWIKNIF